MKPRISKFSPLMSTLALESRQSVFWELLYPELLAAVVNGDTDLVLTSALQHVKLVPEYKLGRLQMVTE